MKRPTAVDRDKSGFIDIFVKELRANNAAVFVGAGLSKAAGFVDWVGLLSPVAEGLGLDAARETDLVTLAQFHLNHNSANRSQLTQILVDNFSDLPDPHENHRILARLPIKTFWTTNYDRLIEKALMEGGKRVDAKYTVSQLAITRPGRDAIIYKMHGDIEHANDAVISKDDYERYQVTHDPYVTALSGDLIEKTFLFIGFSFTDPNLDYILSRVRVRFVTNQRKHFCIARNRKKLRNEKKVDFEYALLRQQLLISDLKRFNIETILVDEYEDITELLLQIEKKYRSRTVFISGSAADYSPWGRSETEEFVSALSRKLIEKDYRITTGFGLGIGSAVASGAIQQIYSSNNRSIEEQLLLRPFPLAIKDTVERQNTFQRYRKELISQAGIAVFIMGNKLDGSKVILANGVKNEFDLAKDNDLYLIPVGGSGWMAKNLWDEVMLNTAKNFGKFESEIVPLMKALDVATDKPMRLIDPIIKIISILSKNN